MRIAPLIPFWLVASACATSVEVPPVYEPLVCDPAAADHIAFGVQESAAWSGPYADKMYGRRFLIIDGSCRYYVGYGHFGQVRGGVLTSDELDAINAELLTGPWEAIDGEHRMDIMGADAWTDSLWRDGLGASCYWSCGAGASRDLRAMLGTAFRWEGQLAERGPPLDGPVQLMVTRGSLEPIDATGEWTGATDIAGALGDLYYGTIIVSDPADTAALRALRAALPSNSLSRVQLRERGSYFLAVVVDAIPHSNADGRLLPPFPIMDYPPPL